MRDSDGIDGVRIRLEEGDREAFDTFYEGLPTDRAIQMIERGPGWVVFQAPGDVPDGVNWRRFGIALLDLVARIGSFPLTKQAIHIDRAGQPRLLPRFVDAPEQTRPPRAVGRFLRSQVPEFVDDQLDAAIDALTDPIPEVQRTARALLLGEVVKPVGRTGEVKITVTSREYESRGDLDRVQSRAAVVIPTSELRGLEPTQRSMAAGMAGLPLAMLDGLAAANLPLVLESHRRAWTARKAAEILRRKTGLPVVAATGAGTMGLLWASALALTTVSTGLGTATFAMLGVWIITVFGGLLTLGLGAMTLWSVVGWASQRRLLSDTRESEEEAHEERARRMGNPHLAAVWEALSSARATLAAAGLPLAPASDVRSVLKAAEQEVEALLKADEIARRGLSTTRPDDVRSRIAQLDSTEASQIARRERLEQTLQELELLELRRHTIVSAADRLAGVLAAVNEALSRWETEVDGDGLAGVLRAAEQVRSTRALSL